MSQPQKSPSLAEQADRHVLYQMAVQDPETEIAFFTKVYSELRGRKPLTMKEDFCGTAYLATEWAKSDPQRIAYGVDYDKDPIDWGQKHNVDTAGAGGGGAWITFVTCLIASLKPSVLSAAKYFPPPWSAMH